MNNAKRSLPPSAVNPFATAAELLAVEQRAVMHRCETCGAPGADKCERCTIVEKHLDGYASTIVGRAKLMHAVRRAEDALGRRAKRPSRPPPKGTP